MATIGNVFAENEEQTIEKYKIFYLVNDYPGMEQANTFKDIPYRAFLPWPQQLSINGFVQIGNEMLIAVNKSSPICVSANLLKPAILKPLPKILSNRFRAISEELTIGSVFTKGESAFFHLYKDMLFFKE